LTPSHVCAYRQRVAESSPAQHGRLRWFEPGELDEAQRALYERIVGRPRLQGASAPALTDEAGRLHGPLNAMLLNPAVGTAQLELGTRVRFDTRFSARIREIAILEVSAQRRCGFEWCAHEVVGRKAGLTGAELDAIRTGASAPTFDATEALVRELVQKLIRDRDLDDATFARATATLGEGGLMDLVAIVNYYDSVALSLAVWRPPYPAGATPPSFD
jgi:alkylhydroperoxidase family enzyme